MIWRIDLWGTTAHPGFEFRDVVGHFADYGVFLVEELFRLCGFRQRRADSSDLFAALRCIQSQIGGGLPHGLTKKGDGLG
jgi:hypothetical protein